MNKNSSTTIKAIAVFVLTGAIFYFTISWESPLAQISTHKSSNTRN